MVKIVYDGLIEMLGGEEPVPLNTNANPPAVVLMAGLQGSGKTTTSAKLALRLTKFDRKKVMMASLDTRRPAAMEQLATLGKQIEVATLPIVAGESAVQITRRALQSAKLQGFDVLILDTAGRITLDEGLMNEVAEVADIAKPVETLLVADSLTGQDAVRTAKAFHERLPLTGLVLTRADGDGRGGAMLSMRAVTGLPIKYLGAGERSMRWTCSTPAASPAAFWVRAISSPWSKRPARIWTRPRPRRWPANWPRVSSIWMIWPASFSR